MTVSPVPIESKALPELRHAQSEPELLACFAVMSQLRPKLSKEQDFIDAVRRQQRQGYRLLAVWCGGGPVALAGYRQIENLIHGRFVYVDDLITVEQGRSQGFGERLLRELQVIGRADGCDRLVLDTALSNALAQRFYFRAGLLARGLHFSMDL